jgi:hypothetical protein
MELASVANGKTAADPEMSGSIERCLGRLDRHTKREGVASRHVRLGRAELVWQ